MKRGLEIIVAGLAAAACVSAPGAMSPAAWPPAARAQLQLAELKLYPQGTRIVEGRQGLVTGTLSPIAVHAGMEALQRGGTAADAAIATSLTQIATNLGSDVSYAGAAQVLYFEARTGKVYALDAGWTGWRGETAPETIPAADLSLIGAAAGTSGAEDGRKTLVPGFMAGMEALNSRFGKLSLANLLKPSIWYAENGLAISPLLASYFSMQEKYLNRTPEGRAFAHPAGALPKTGDLYKQADLAATLKGVARHGASFMYGGDWGRAYVAAVNAHGGKASLADMRAYKPVWSEPPSVAFAGGRVFGPATGATDCSVLEALSLMDAAELVGKPAYWRDPDVFRAYADILRFAEVGPYMPAALTFERANGFASTCAGRITPQYAAAVLPHIRDLIRPPAPPTDGGHHSASVVAVDRWGNVAAVVHSINAAVWGDTGIVVGGVPVSNAGGLYKARMALLPPGSRLPNDMAPVIALKDGRPWLAVATIGTSLVPETVRQVTGLASGVDPVQLMTAPPLLFNFEVERMELVPSGAYPPAFLDALKAGGLPIREETALRVATLRGTSVLSWVSPTGSWRSVETPGVLGFADGH